MNNCFIQSLFIATVLFLLGCKSKLQDQMPWKYPNIKATSAIDNYFGKEVIDNYRVLEDRNNIIVKKWEREEKEFCDSIVTNILGKDSLIKDIRRFINSANEKTPVPRASEENLFFVRNDYQEYCQKLICTDTLGNNEIVLYSTADLVKSGTSYSIDYYEPSFDGKFIAMGVSASGSELSTIYVVDVKKRILLGEKIEGCFHGYPNWLPDGSGFFYNKLKELGEEGANTMYENSSVRLHILYSEPRDDQEIFSNGLNRDLDLKNIDLPFLITFPKSDIVLSTIYRGSAGYSLIYYARLRDVLKNPKKVNWKAISSLDDKVGGYSLFDENLFLLKFKENSYGNIEKIDLRNPSDSKIVMKADGYVLQEIVQNKKAIYIKCLKNGLNGIIKLDPISLNVKDIKLPFVGSASLTFDRYYINSNAFYVGLESWAIDWNIYKLGEDGQFFLTSICPQGKSFEFLDITSKEVLVPSYDGTLIPLSIIYRRDLKLNGLNPTLLYAYGAYGTSITPFYLSNELAWLNNGGVYAIAHVRGGGEKGDQWYKDGFKATKANSWKDFIACAEYLIDNDYTSKNKLAVHGTSAGGITVGRALTERPDLFKAAILEVGILNALRFENSKNTANVSEFGTSKDSLEFKYLYEMDVYHHIQKGITYPSVLFSASTNDARVELWQSSKVVAKMQQFSSGKNLILFNINDQGHYGDNGYAEEYSFLFWQLGHKNFNFKVK